MCGPSDVLPRPRRGLVSEQRENCQAPKLEPAASTRFEGKPTREVKGLNTPQKLTSASLLALALLVMAAGLTMAQSQADRAVDQSCARWLLSREAALTDGSMSGFRTGYAHGVISAVDSGAFVPRVRRGTSIKSVTELVTGIDSLCASSPQERVIDVALYLLGLP